MTVFNVFALGLRSIEMIHFRTLGRDVLLFVASLFRMSDVDFYKHDVLHSTLFQILKVFVVSWR